MHRVTVTSTDAYGHVRAGCTCGLRWSNVSYDGGDGNRQNGDLLRHLRATGGRFAGKPAALHTLLTPPR